MGYIHERYKKYHRDDCSGKISNTPVVKEYWCPYCNCKVADLSKKFCDCGWEVNVAGSMSAKCPDWLWERHLPFINEYRYLKEKGVVKSGYEYFKLKVGHTDIGRIIVKKVEYGYSKEEEERRKLYYSTNNSFPEDWK